MLCVLGLGADGGNPSGFVQLGLLSRAPGRAGSGMEKWEQDRAGCLRKRMVQSVLEQGQNGLMLARGVLGLECVLQTAACAASFAWSPGQMPYSFQELGAERGSLPRQQGVSYNDLNHLFRRNINGICKDS